MESGGQLTVITHKVGCWNSQRKTRRLSLMPYRLHDLSNLHCVARRDFLEGYSLSSVSRMAKRSVSGSDQYSRSATSRSLGACSFFRAIIFSRSRSAVWMSCSCRATHQRTLYEKIIREVGSGNTKPLNDHCLKLFVLKRNELAYGI